MSSASDGDRPDLGSAPDPDATVVTVLSFDAILPPVAGSRRALVRWSDGRIGEALRWYDDEILFCEGDLIGRTQTQLRELKFARDKGWLSS